MEVERCARETEKKKEMQAAKFLDALHPAAVCCGCSLQSRARPPPPRFHSRSRSRRAAGERVLLHLSCALRLQAESVPVLLWPGAASNGQSVLCGWTAPVTAASHLAENAAASPEHPAQERRGRKEESGKERPGDER